jgi:hypothetical protein
VIAVGLGADIESEVKKRVPFFLPFFRSRSTMDIDTMVCQDRLGTDVRWFAKTGSGKTYGRHH